MAKKKKVKPADLLNTSVGDLVANMAALQNDHRELMGSIQADVVEAVESIKQLEEMKKTKEEELKALHGAEKKLDDMKALDRDYQEAVTQHQYELDRLKRQYEEEVERYGSEMERRKRERAWLFEDEDRQRVQEHKALKEDLENIRGDLDARAQELGAFDDMVKAEVEKITAVIKRNHDIQLREAKAAQQAEILVKDAALDAKMEQISDLQRRLSHAEKARDDAQARAAAIATSALDKDAGSQALQELRLVAHKQAESKK